MVHAPFLSAAFSSQPPFQGWPINVKNTFINFDVKPRVGAAHRRAATCPRSLWSNLTDDNMATQELCHAMSPKQPNSIGKCFLTPAPRSDAFERVMEPSPSRPKKLRNNKTVKKPNAGTGKESAPVPCALKVHHEQEPQPPFELVSKAASPQNAKQESPNAARKPCPLEGLEVDVISDVSTASSVTPEALAQQEEVKWTSITAKKKFKPRNIDVTASPSDAKVHTPVEQSHSSPSDRRDRPAARPGYQGSSKGLPFFRKIEVGIEDDMEFRVVQRLIGPRGKYMQDITEKCRGAKVWIIGRGSRSREDSVGPLMICVGATSLVEFEAAVGHINELLAWVHKEHRRFHRST